MTAPSSHPKAQAIIFARQDVKPNVRVSAYWLYAHELGKDSQSAACVLENVLLWMDEQNKIEARRKLEPTLLERRLLHMVINEELNMKQIALRNHKGVTMTKMYFKRMRDRLGVITLHRLAALAVERGWVKFQEK